MKPTRPPHPQGIDWQRLQERLAHLAAAEHSPRRAQEVLEERARALARAPAPAADARGVLDVVLFELAGERYAVETCHVREVIRMPNFTPLPGAPDFLVGVINLRGHLLAVIDLGKFFGVAGRGVTDQARVVVLGGERTEFGVLADAASEVAALPRDALLEPPDSIAGITREYLRGVTEDALIVLDGAVLLRDPRLFIGPGEGGGP
jgi:purine-binding chemotaxis protein CheW